MNRSIQGLFAITLCAAATVAQDLRKALASADLVAVARQVGQTKKTEDVTLHRLQLVEGIRGRDRGRKTVAVLDWPKLSLHHRPVVRQTRLYCLLDASAAAQRLRLPAAEGPYYKMVGWAGSNPLITGDRDENAIVHFARILANAEAGTASDVTAAAIATAALNDDPVVRLEATRLLAERPHLRTRLTALRWNQLLTRASGETEDIAYKIALAELCAEQRLDGVAEALILGLGSVQHRDYARAVGRILVQLRGDEAIEPLLERMRNHQDSDERPAILLAIGATRTAPALRALLEFKRVAADDRAIDAALQEHRSRRALEAVLDGKKRGK